MDSLSRLFAAFPVELGATETPNRRAHSLPSTFENYSPTGSVGGERWIGPMCSDLHPSIIPALAVGKISMLVYTEDFKNVRIHGCDL